MLVFTLFAVHDRCTRGRIHPATAWGCTTLIVLANVLAVFIGPNETWQRIVAWLTV